MKIDKQTQMFLMLAAAGAAAWYLYKKQTGNTAKAPAASQSAAPADLMNWYG